MSLIEIEQVSFAYDSKPDAPALEGVSLRVERGSFVGVTGPSGAGKSTLVRLLAGYIPHFFGGRLTGRVRVGGRDTTELGVAELAERVGVVFENPFDQLTGATMTVLEEVAFALENLGLPRQEILERARGSLDRVGIGHLADRHPRRLSGGQSQRVAIAAVLALQPEILVLDEPTSQLDPLGADEVFEVLRAMHGQDITVVVVSQDVERLVAHAERLLVMDGGRIVHDGPPRDVLAALGGLAGAVSAGGSRPSDRPLLRIPSAARIGLRLRAQGRVGQDRPLPLTAAEAAAELRDVLGAAPAGEAGGARYGGIGGAGPSPDNGAGGAPDRATGGAAVGEAHPVMTDNARPYPVVLENVHYVYPGGVEALRGISLAFGPGRTCIVGQNGAGKTTLVRHLNGLLKPSAGRVLVGGVDTRSRTVAQLARYVGLSFQNPDDQLFHRTVEEEVRFGAVNLGYDAATVDRLVNEALALLRLEDVRRANPFDLGLSERKRVAIASVVAMDTPVVVLDEPTGGQDAPGVVLLGRLVDELAARGKTVITITHDVEFAAAHADRVIALHQGRVLLDGPPAQVFREVEALARTYVRPPTVTEIGLRLGLPHAVLREDELLARVPAPQ